MACFDDNTAVEFFDGTLSDSQNKNVEAHAAQCSSCRQLLAELARSPSLAGMGPTLPAAGDAHIDLERGDEVGRFVILNRIGHGGMGVVFAAYDPKLDRKVALKLLRSSEDSESSPQEAQTRLLREAQAIAQQSHPNTISVYDVGTYKSEVYIAMELVEGDTLTGWLRKWDRPWRDVLDKFLQAGRALAAAHGSGLVHRDFKPDNVLVGQDERVRVMDFGLARSLFREPSAVPADNVFTMSVDGVSELNRSLTRTGAMVGTPRYMAPEQFRGHETDARTDQFSFCVALYEALYHRHPFEGGTSRPQLKDDGACVRAPPRNTQVPDWLHKAVERGIEAVPGKRHPSMDILLREITPRRKPVSRRGWVALATVLAAAIVLLAVYLWQIRADARAALDEVKLTKAQVAAAMDELRTLKQEIVVLERERDALTVELRETAATSEEVQRLRMEIEAKDLAIAERDLRIASLVENTRPKRRPRPQPKVVGLNRQQVRDAIKPGIEDIKSCFKEWRERVSVTTTTVDVTFSINPDGGFGGATTETAYEMLGLCIKGVLKSTSFPPSDAITMVAYSFTTTPTELRKRSKIVDRKPAPAGLPVP